MGEGAESQIRDLSRVDGTPAAGEESGTLIEHLQELFARYGLGVADQS
jgi:hypothetical protein